MLDSDGDEDEDEITLHDTTSQFTPGVQEELLQFHDKVIASSVAGELKIPDEDSQFEDAQIAQWGITVKPFGPLR